MNAQPRGISAATLAALRARREEAQAQADELQRLRAENARLRESLGDLLKRGKVAYMGDGERWRISLSASECERLHGLVAP